MNHHSTEASPSGAPPRAGSPWLRHAVLAVIAVLYTLAVLQWSARNGRLAQEISYDDNGYFVDGLRRLNVLQDGGLPALWASLRDVPPHSPYSTLAAMTAFGLGGVNDWAPYASNVLLVGMFLLAVAHCAGLLATSGRILIAVFSLSIPFCFAAVHEFRPDWAVALFTAVGVMLGVEAVLRRPPREGRLALGGLCLGLAFLIKPPFFPHTAVLAAVTGGIILAAGIGWLGGQKSPPAATVRRLGIFGAAVVLPPLPFYVLDYRHILEYFASNTGKGADAELWRIKGGWVETLVRYTVNGPMGDMLGNYFPLFLLLLVGGLILAFRRRDGLLPELLGLSAAASASMAIMLYGRYENPFFGLPYQFLLTFAAVRSAVFLMREIGWARRVVPGVLALAFFWNVASERRNPYTLVFQGPPVAETGPVSKGLLDAILGQLPALPPGAARRVPEVKFAFSGQVNAATLEWLALKRGADLRLIDLHRATRADEILSRLGDGDFVVLGEPGTSGLYNWLPSTGLQGEILDRLRWDGRPLEIARVPARGGGYRVFRQENLLTIGWPLATEGILPVEGPYPQWNLGLVRWGIFPATQLKLAAQAIGPASLRLEGRAPEAGQEVAVWLNGEPAGRHAFSTLGFEEIIVPLALRAGENLVELRYRSGEPPAADGNRRAVLFRRFDVIRR